MDEKVRKVFDLVRVGWNYGDTLDALGEGLESETAWHGNPRADERVVRDVRVMGFKTLRVPTSWGRHCDGEGTVDPRWMARVRDVVNYGYERGMTVVLNTHHDNEFYDIGGCVCDEKLRADVIKKMKNLWSQIADEFRGYDGRLVFETLNEPRTEHSPLEWQGGTAPERAVVDELNREIFATIRSSGGNNSTRLVLLPPYAASALDEALEGMWLPQDENFAVSIHAYHPHDFAMSAAGPREYSAETERAVDELLARIDERFCSKGVPVVLGEFGATGKKNLGARREYLIHYVATAKKYGMPCIVWDNNVSAGEGEEHFGLYERSWHRWVYPELAEAIVHAANGKR